MPTDPVSPPGPLTLGTAGHIDHGKTALIRALTGVDTDRLPEEHRRGISIALGYAALRLPSGRQLSVVDVPGHERFVRTMVAGATGIDLALMVIAADDGVMPQTREHAAVLAALGIDAIVVAVTKSDLTDPGPATQQARELLPHASAIIPCSSRTSAGIAALTRALDELAAGIATRDQRPGDPLLHIDRAFTVAGIGTVVTGTLWSGTLHIGDRLTVLPGTRAVRVRGLQVHDEPLPSAAAGQRVAVNLAGVRARDLTRGDVLTVAGRVAETTILDCALTLDPRTRHGEHVQVHHGTRDVPARLADLDDGLWQLRLEKPVAAADGDRVVVRRLSPPDTLGGGTILDAAARRHGRRPDVIARLRGRAAGGLDPVSAEGAAGSGGPAQPTGPRDGRPPPDADQAPLLAGLDRTAPAAAVEPVAAGVEPVAAGVEPVAAGVEPLAAGVDDEPPTPAELDAQARLTVALRDAGLALLNAAGLDTHGSHALAALRGQGVAVRVSGQLYGHSEVVAEARARLVGTIAARGSISLTEARDLLGTGRKSAQAFLEHLDTERITRRGTDDRRVLRPGR